MQKITRTSSALALTAALALAACGGGDANQSAAGDSAAAGTVAAAPGATDSAAGATGTGGAMAGDMGAMSEPNVMSLVGMSNATEIQTSDIAQTKATNAQVKAFARDMIREHQAMQKQADQLATRLNVTPQPPAQAQQKQQMLDQMVQQLNSTAKGAEFDRAYMDGQVQAHQQTLTELQGLQNSVQNAELRTLIQQAIPKVEQHLQRAQTLQSNVGGAGAGAGKSGN
jgi:putative membrane protein